MTKEFVLTLWNANYEAICLIHFAKFHLFHWKYASLCLGRIILAINVFNFRDLKALLGKHCLWK